METLIQILGLSCLTTLIIQTDWYKGTLFDRKPFSCAMCSGFWYTVGILVSLHGWAGIPYAALAGTIAEFIDRELNKY